MKTSRRKLVASNHRCKSLSTSVIFVAFALCAFSQSVNAQPKTQQQKLTWKLEYDTRIPLHDSRGSIVGSTRIAAGTVLDVLPPNKASAGKNVIPLRHMGEVFELPTGPDLQALLVKQNPSGTPPEKQVLDLHRFKIEELTAKRKTSGRPGPPIEELPPTFSTETIAMDLPADAPSEIPKNFPLDKTVIIPGKFGYLKLPFIKQTKPGICTAAASINAVRYLHPEIQLSGSELFRLYNNRPNGASFEEASLGNLQLGVKCRIVRIASMPRPELVRMIHKSIEENLPVIAADVRHALLIYGFNKETKKLFVWNQWGNGKIVDGMPKGTYLLQESDLPIEFTDLLFVSKVRFKPLESLQQALEAKVGTTEDLQVHPVAGKPFGGIQHYLPYSVPQRIKATLRAGRTILLPQGEDVLSVSPDEVKTDTVTLQCRYLPSGKTSRLSLESLTQLISLNYGEFYSVKQSEKLPAREAGTQSPRQPSS